VPAGRLDPVHVSLAALPGVAPPRTKPILSKQGLLSSFDRPLVKRSRLEFRLSVWSDWDAIHPQ